MKSRRKKLSDHPKAIMSREFRERNPGYNAERQRRWRSKWPDRVLARRIAEAKKRQKDPRNQLVKAAWSRAVKKKIPFDLKPSDLVIPSHCPVLGIEIKRTGVKRTGNSPSLDRIIPSRGYVKGNVIMISWRANDLKRDASIEELMAIAKFYKKYARKKS